jgi:hypothetical protein
MPQTPLFFVLESCICCLQRSANASHTQVASNGGRSEPGVRRVVNPNGIGGTGVVADPQPVSYIRHLLRNTNRAELSSHGSHLIGSEHRTTQTGTSGMNL